MAIISYTGTFEEYQRMEERCGQGHNRKCIDGRVTGCGKCVGYCKYAGHPGFLTERQRAEHDCLGKGCAYYLPKPEKIRSLPKTTDPARLLLEMARNAVSEMEGLKVTRVMNRDGSWIANYVTLSNEYRLDQAEKMINRQSGFRFRFNRLDLDFDTCVQIVMGVQ